MGDVTYILLSQESDSALGRELNVSKQCINQVRKGLTYKNLAPDLPRRSSEPRVPCTSCAYWGASGCGLEVPEALTDPFFARECSYFNSTESSS